MTAAPRKTLWIWIPLLTLAVAGAASMATAGSTARVESTTLTDKYLLYRVYEVPRTPASEPARVLGIEAADLDTGVLLRSMDIPSTTDAAEDIEPDIAYNMADGYAYIVWAKKDMFQGDHDIVITQFNGLEFPRSNLLTVNGVDDRTPRIAAGPDGVLHIVWQSGDTVEYRAFSPEAGILWAQTVSDGSRANHSPTVTTDASGRAWIAFMGDKGYGSQVIVRAQDPGTDGPGGVNTAISPLMIATYSVLGVASGPVEKGPWIHLVEGSPVTSWLSTDPVSGITALEYRFLRPDGVVSEPARVPIGIEMSRDRAQAIVLDHVRRVFQAARFVPSPTDSVPPILIGPKSASETPGLLDQLRAR